MLLPEVARRQHGVFSRRQARRAGIDYRTVRRRLRDGVWVELFTDAFTLAGTDRTARVLAQAAVLATTGVVSHDSAAALHGIDAPSRQTDPSTVHVTMEPRTHAVVPGVVEHRLRLAAADETSVDGIPVTTRTRTVVDLLASRPRNEAAGLLFRATQNGWLSDADLVRAIAQRKGMHGTPQLRALARMTSTGAHSVAEHALHEVLATVDGIDWSANAPVQIAGRRFMVDVLLPSAHVVVEVDGQGFHTDAERFQHDRERQNLLVGAGYTVLRFTWLDITTRPGYVRATILGHLA